MEELWRFIDYLNSINEKIQWTFEVEKDGIISFLDVLVNRNEQGDFSTTVFRKATHSDRYLHFTSNHPMQHKLSAIMTLRFRALAYCSSESLLLAELQHIEKTFIANGYPAELVHRILFSEDKKIMQLEELKLDVDEKIGCLVIPYVKEIHKQVVVLTRNLDVHLLYSRTANLGNLVAPKRPQPVKEDTRECIYKINCLNCVACYIGETKRKLRTRVAEHKGSCIKAFRDGFVMSSEKYDTGLPLHAMQKDHTFDFENVEILDTEKNMKRRRFLEAIHIAMNKNTVNSTKGRHIDMNWAHVIDLFKHQNPIEEKLVEEELEDTRTRGKQDV
jgi:hypothetical protein